MNYNELVVQATEAANVAGDEWIRTHTQPRYSVHNSGSSEPVGYMLDVCGNAHVKFSDRRSKHFKKMRGLGLIRHTDSGVVDIYHKYRHRQEYGLAVACAEAARNVLKQGGIDKLNVWSYVD